MHAYKRAGLPRPHQPPPLIRPRRTPATLAATAPQKSREPSTVKPYASPVTRRQGKCPPFSCASVAPATKPLSRPAPLTAVGTQFAAHVPPFRTDGFPASTPQVLSTPTEISKSTTIINASPSSHTPRWNSKLQTQPHRYLTA